jgi:hypothetical protein
VDHQRFGLSLVHRGDEEIVCRVRHGYLLKHLDLD